MIEREVLKFTKEVHFILLIGSEVNKYFNMSMEYTGHIIIYVSIKQNYGLQFSVNSANETVSNTESYHRNSFTLSSLIFLSPIPSSLVLHIPFRLPTLSIFYIILGA